MADLERDIDEPDSTEIVVSDAERRQHRRVMDKTTGKDLDRQWSGDMRKEVEEAEELLAPPMITEPRCSVCTSQHRVWIERQLVKGENYSAIARQMETAPGGPINRRSIGNHFEKHMRIQDAVVRAQLEQEARLLGQNYEEGIESALTNRGIIKVAIQKIYDDMTKGLVTGEVRDLVQLMKLHNEMESNVSQVRSEEAEAHFRVFMIAIKNVCDDETKAAIVAEVKRLTQLDDVEFKAEQHLGLPQRTNIDAEIPEADIVDETPSS